ncbi:MAG: HD domain-containing phosphohydrolase [Candidatus Omnitrophota bacterium]
MTKQMSDDDALLGIFFEKILENAEKSVMVTDEKGVIMFINAEFRDFFDASRGDTIGKEWIDLLVPHAKRKDISVIFDNIKAEEILSKFDTPVIAADDIIKFMSWTTLPLRKDGKKLYLFFGSEEKYPSARNGIMEYSLTKNRLSEECREVVDILFTASMKSEPGTASHSSKVMLLSIALAKKLKLGKKKIENIKVAALLHDLGKLAIDGKILFKKGKLNEAEYDQIKNHPEWGAKIASFIYFLRDIVPIMICHHENYDGTGYPKGKRGEDIPIESRILSVADIYEALTADRPYREGFLKEEAVAIIKGERGRKLDPRVTDVFLEMLRNNEVGKGDL